MPLIKLVRNFIFKIKRKSNSFDKTTHQQHLPPEGVLSDHSDLMVFVGVADLVGGGVVPSPGRGAFVVLRRRIDPHPARSHHCRRAVPLKESPS